MPALQRSSVGPECLSPLMAACDGGLGRRCTAFVGCTTGGIFIEAPISSLSLASLLTTWQFGHREGCSTIYTCLRRLLDICECQGGALKPIATLKLSQIDI